MTLTPPIETSPLMLDRQLPRFTQKPEYLSEKGQILEEVLEHLLHWVAVKLENEFIIGSNVSDVENAGHPPVDALDEFLQRVTMRFRPQAATAEDIIRLHRMITSDVGTVMDFMHDLIQFLFSRWDFDVLKEITKDLISATSRWASKEIQRSELGMQTGCPGWVSVNEADHYVTNVYWMIPAVLLQQLEYSNIRRRLTQLAQLNPYPEIRTPSKPRSKS